MSNTRQSRRSVAATIGAAALVGAVMFVGGCGDDSTEPRLDPRFDPETVTIVIGDTIRFVAVSGDHTVTSGTGSNDPNSGDLFDDGLPEGNDLRLVFDDADTIDYYCVPHEHDGMAGQIRVTAPASRTVEVFVSGTAFNPQTVTVNPGDIVRWTVNGSHTITSGTGLADPQAGADFDVPRTTGQEFTRLFVELGTFPYFCRLHVGMGMTGTVNVVERTNQTVEVEALE